MRLERQLGHQRTVLDAAQELVEHGAIPEQLVERGLWRIGRFLLVNGLDASSDSLCERRIDHVLADQLGQRCVELVGLGVLVNQVANEVRRAAERRLTRIGIFDRGTRAKSAQLFA